MLRIVLKSEVRKKIKKSLLVLIPRRVFYLRFLYTTLEFQELYFNIIRC